MPRFYSLDFPRHDYSGVTDVEVDLPGLALPGETLGELLAHLEAATGVSLVAIDGGRRYRYRSPRLPGTEQVVDVHITREGELLRPQDLTFALLPDDIIEALSEERLTC